MKHYRDIDAARLMEAVAEQGGRWLDETHAGQEHEFIMSDGKVIRHTSPYDCEEEALFLVAYDPSETVIVNEPRLMPDPNRGGNAKVSQKDPDTGDVIYDEVERSESFEGQVVDRAFVKVCANDDLLREWPRFRKHMVHGDPTRT